jgi:LacI family transcriptional regulator
MPVTLRDIAERSGVSVSTVTRVLNDKAREYRISDETSQLVLKTARRLKYRPNQLARGLRLKKTHTIGLLAPDIANPFFAYVTRQIQNIAAEKDYSIVICNTNENQDIEIEQTQLLLSKGIDGFIIMPVGLSFKHLLNVKKEGVPVVLIDRCFEELPFNSVVIDNYRGAYEAVNHIIEYGHDRIAMIQGLPHTYTNNGRVAGYRAALREHKINFNRNYLVGTDFGKENGYISAKALLSQKKRPTALFLSSDLIALGALEAIFELGLRIPDDVSLVAFDDIDFAPFLVSPLTVVSQPKDQIGERAVNLLIDQIGKINSRRTKTEILQPELIIRGSVKRITRYSKKLAG